VQGRWRVGRRLILTLGTFYYSFSDPSVDSYIVIVPYHHVQSKVRTYEVFP
jgi:hypothetical protein